MNEKIIHFTDLTTWKKAHDLILTIYTITKKFPPSEQYGLTSQLRRCAVSITSNIAEGFGRNHSKDKLQFYIIARGSLLELENQIIIAKDIEYIPQQEYQKILEKITATGKLLTGLMKAIPQRTLSS